MDGIRLLGAGEALVCRGESMFKHRVYPEGDPRVESLNFLSLVEIVIRLLMCLPSRSRAIRRSGGGSRPRHVFRHWYTEIVTPELLNE